MFLVAGLAFAPVSDWTAPPECADVDAVFAAAETFGAEVEQASLTLEGRIEAVEGGFRLDLEIETPSGTTARQQWKTPSRSIASTRRHSSSG